MRNPPPDVIASWPEANFVDPEYQGPQLAIVAITLLVFSFVIVALRIWVRVQMKKRAGWDDWIMVIAMPFVLGCTVCSVIGTQRGWGFHIWDNKPEWDRGSRLASWCNQMLYIVIMTLIKVSILSSFLRFSTNVWLPRLSWTLIAINVAWGISFAVALCFACKPLDKYWNAHHIGNHCDDESGRVISASILTIVTDILVFLLPLPTFWKLWLPMREKAVLIALMSMGLIACVASVIRTYYIWKTLVTYDVTWNGYNVWLWTVIEVNFAVIGASIPTLRPFARRYLPNLGFKNSSGRSRYGGGVSAGPRSTVTGLRMDQIGRHKSEIHDQVGQNRFASSSTDSDFQALREEDSRSMVSNGESANRGSDNSYTIRVYGGDMFTSPA